MGEVTKPNPIFDIDPYDAENAISNGDAVRLKVFLEETGETLSKLSHMISEMSLKEEFKSEHNVEFTSSDNEDEWIGPSSQARLAMERRDFVLVAEYASQLSQIMARLGMLVDPDRAISERYIAGFGLRKKGRPRKNINMEMFERSSLELKSRFSFLRTKKKEASIQEVIDEGGPSRATQFRKLRRSKKA